MKAFNVLSLLLIVNGFCVLNLMGQVPAPARIVILPFHSNGVDTVYVQTAESILRTEIGKLSGMDIVSLRRTKDVLEGASCAESECALDAGRKLNATQVLGCQLSALGEKIIAQYFLVNVSTGKESLIDQATATNADELDVLMKRLAKSVVDLEPIDKNAEVGKILSSESAEPQRRASRTSAGISFGYLYPQAGYDNGDRSLTVDVRFDYELQDYAFGVMAGGREGFAMNLYGSYLLSKRDFCPYVGGAVGIHWVSHGPRYYTLNSTQQNVKSDGFEFTAHAGMRILHTYNFQMIFNLEYVYTMNDYNDRAIVFTIGIL